MTPRDEALQGVMAALGCARWETESDDECSTHGAEGTIAADWTSEGCPFAVAALDALISLGWRIEVADQDPADRNEDWDLDGPAHVRGS